ncbi:MAG: hypothetical protein HY922_12235 [Elusimicrobia bacterium]|nr:hypothetical protein [Elusimicrobiota bacterium]
MAEGSGVPARLDDFDRIVASLNKNGVDFMIIGGYAVIFHGHVRTTKDLDIMIRRTPENARRAIAALEEAGCTCPELTPELFMAGKGITFGEPPMRIDVLSDIRGVAFDDAWSRRQISRFGPNEANFIGLDDLIANKEAVARPQDLADAQKLNLAREKSLQPKKGT